MRGDSRKFSFFLGIAVSGVLLMPAFRPGGFPLIYVLVLLLGFVTLVREGIRLPYAIGRIYLPWVVASVYAVLHALIFGSEQPFQLAVRSGIAIIAGILVALSIRSRTMLVWLFLGMLPLFMLDGLVAIGQFFRVPQANDAAMWFFGFTPGNILEATLRFESSRVSGIESYSHLFSYNQGVWLFFAFWCFLIFRSPVQNILSLLVVAVASLAVIVAAQRAIVWTVFPGMVMLYILARGVVKSTIVLGVVVALVVGYDVAEWLLTGNEVVGRLGSLTDRASDTGRIASLLFAIDQISQNPFWGNTRGVGFQVGVHNGFLNGWAKFGILWAVAFVVALYTTVRSILGRSAIPLWYRAGGVLLLGMMLANVMGHTTSPGQDDMTFMVAIGLILALLQQGDSENSVTRRVAVSSYTYHQIRVPPR